MSIDEGRRRALGILFGGLVGGIAAGRAATPQPKPSIPGPPPGAKSAPGGPVVARARREGMASPDGVVNAAVLEAGLAAAVARAAGEANAVDGLRRLFKPSDVVGIKVNCIAGRGLSTHPEAALVLAKLLQQAGVPGGRIVIWDRTERELRAAGFTVGRGADGVRVYGTNDEYERDVREWGPAGSCFAKVLATEMTALIDLAVLKHHGASGVSFGMKNWYGAVQNPNKLHGDNCQPYIGALAAYPLIKDRLRLTVVDGVVGQCHGGPGRSPKFQWSYGGFLASTDPVAVDAIAWGEIEARRKATGMKPLKAEGTEPVYIANAASRGLGVADPAKIRVEEV